MTSPRFSFLTTAYRTEAYLPATIRSVLAQTGQDWELVVVDNGPSDEMARIVRSFAQTDSRITLIRQQNSGYRGGVRAAAQAAVGEFVCVLDSDDHLEPDFCARVGALLDREPTVDAVGVDAHRFVEPEEINLPVGYMRSIGATKAGDPTRRLSLTDVLAGQVPYSTAAIRRTAWDSVGGYDPGIDDVDESVIVWCRLTRAFDVRLLPERLARYRLRADSLSRDAAGVETFERQLINSFVTGAAGCSDPADRAALERTLRRLRYHQALRRARTAMTTGDVSAARRSIAAAAAQKRSLRVLIISSGLRLSPTALRLVHPAKQRLTSLIPLLLGRLNRRPVRPAAPRPGRDHDNGASLPCRRRPVLPWRPVTRTTKGKPGNEVATTARPSLDGSQ